MKSNHLKNIGELNLAMLFISTSGVLGRYITIPPPVTIWLRCILAVVIIGLYCKYRKLSFSIQKKTDLKALMLSGIFLGAHWITYFYSLQLSNVAIAMLSLFTFPIITTFLEPLFLKTKLIRKHIVLGAIVLFGIYYLTPEIDIENEYTKGILFGLLSALFYALRNVILKQKIANYDGSMLMFYQLATLALVLAPVIFFFEIAPSANEINAILLLALVTTAIGHTLFVRSFRNFSVSSASIMSSIQPIYGIVLGMVFLNEIPAQNTVIGGILILSTVVLESIQSRKD